MTRKGQGIAYEAIWATKMEPWAAQWAQAETDVHDYEGPYDESTYGPYLHWYHGATRWRCFPVPANPEPHEATIRDTFASEPAAAFHALVCYTTPS